MQTTPWEWRTDDATYYLPNGDAWLYRVIPLSPISPEFVDPIDRLNAGATIERALVELGETSRESATQAASFANYRDVHLVALTWEAVAKPPKGTTGRLVDYLDEVLDFVVPNKALFIGVKLRGNLTFNDGVVAGMKKIVGQLLDQGEPDWTRFQNDHDEIHRILDRNLCKVPTAEQIAQLESWYNLGRGTDVLLKEETNRIVVDDFDTVEFSAAMSIPLAPRESPYWQWIAEAEAYRHGPRVVSIRATLEPPGATRRRLQRSQRQFQAAIQEEMEADDIDRPELAESLHLAQAVEEHFANSNEPMLTSSSIVMGARSTDASDTYIDFLRTNHGIEMKPLMKRQMPALIECLPGGGSQLGQHRQEISVGMVAYAGLQGFSEIGDANGLLVGTAYPSLTPVFHNVRAASATSKPAGVALLGDSGSGKTFMAQHMAYQAALAGEPVFFINPKTGSNLQGLVELTGGRQIRMSQLESTKGAFDPFRYAESPQQAAELLADHVVSVIDDLDRGEEGELRHGILRGAMAGARCGWEAMSQVKNPKLLTEIRQLIETMPVFALGIGLEPQSRLDGASGLTLIDFDRKLNLPAPGKVYDLTLPERVALSGVRIVTQAALRILLRLGGGMMVLDEAWTFLSHPSGVGILTEMGREGRSQSVSPVLCTQRVQDLLAVDFESFLSRVFLMQLTDPKEAEAGLKLIGLQVDPGRIKAIGSFGPDPELGRSSTALYQDIKGRRSEVYIAPFSQEFYRACTTTPEERRRFDEVRARQQAEFGGNPAVGFGGVPGVDG